MAICNKERLGEKLEYATELIEAIPAKKDQGNIQIVEAALRIMQFGELSVDEMLEYLESR